jgi:hypothetical protein
MSYATITHVAAEGPFKIVSVAAVRGSHDEVVGSRSDVEVAGLLTVGWALARRDLLNGTQADCDQFFEVRDAKGRTVRVDSRFDYRGRKRPAPPRVVAEDDCPF